MPDAPTFQIEVQAGPVYEVTVTSTETSYAVQVSTGPTYQMQMQLGTGPQGPVGPQGPAGADGTGTVNQVNGVDPVAGNVTLEASDIDGFAPVAISGSYADLDDKPSIPDSPDDIGAAADDDPRFVGVPVSTKSAAYTLVAGDAGSIVEVNSASAVNVTVPASTFAAGQIVEVCQLGAGQVTIVAGSGVTLRSADGLKIAKQYSSASLRFRSATEAVVSGAMTS